MAGQVLGIAIIKVDGQALRSEPGASHDPGGFKRTAIVGDQPGDVAYAQQNKQSTTKCVVMFDASSSLVAMNAWSDVTVQFDADTGQSYVTNHAFLVDTTVLTAGQGGKIPLEFQGPPSREI